LLPATWKKQGRKCERNGKEEGKDEAKRQEEEKNKIDGR